MNDAPSIKMGKDLIGNSQEKKFKWSINMWKMFKPH